MNNFFRAAIAGLVISYPSLLSAQPLGDSTTRVDYGNHFIAVPILFYGEETSWGFGATSGYYFAREGMSKISNIQGSAVYTLRNQASIAVYPKIYTPSRNFYYSGHARASYYPDKFFGTGRTAHDSLEEGYTSRDLSLLFQRQRVLFEVLMVGIQAQYSYFCTSHTNPSGALASGTVIGVNTYHTFGPGIVATWDNRDNLFYPSNGEFYKISILAYSKLFRSDWDFARISLDLRNYYTLKRSNILALQLYGDLTWGDVPFQQMPALGGSDILRGYYKGRFRDQMMLCAQLEYRFQLHGWLKGTIFASAGDVADRIDSFSLKQPKYSFGLGLRTRVNPANVHLRLDAAFTTSRKPAVYLTASEAF